MTGPPKPHGGRLVNRVLTDKRSEEMLKEANEMPKIEVDKGTILDVDKVAIGAFSPLEGFMKKGDLESVISNSRLASGLPWTIPIILAPKGIENEKILGTIKQGDDIVLSCAGKPTAILHLEEKFKFEKKEMIKQIYGTTNPDHPNVKDLYDRGDVLLGGKIDLIQRVNLSFTQNELTPSETRGMFKERGWETIAGYQTRNPPHMAHEYLQRCALEIVDGLFVHPVVGKLKKDDFSPEVILESYRFLIDNYYPRERVLLATLPMEMRYAGPKAAVFLAIIRKNYGCTHFVVGRDIAGTRNYYDPYSAHEVFEELDLGIEPILYRESFYCKRCRLVATDKTCGHNIENHLKISMTEIRETIRNGVEPPVEVMRPEIAKILMKYNGSTSAIS
ncbi:MAG: sulfate adenylyltransferase [Candidatus Thorarchaeota archaeon]|nr:sulfate adenylyltransferase [Candidatus Thorarchaeota archaeon]